jgi:putative serine protease PepD
MTPATLTPSSDPGHLWPDDAGSDPPDGAGRPAPPAGRPRRRRPLALLLVASAVLGGASTAGVLAAAGLTGGGSTTTTTVLERAGGATTGASGLDAQAVYASASAGVVDITVHSQTAAGPATPFGGAQPQSQTPASGTGFVVDGHGHIVTAAHVVDGATSITVKFQDGTSRQAKVLGKDDATDVAVIRVDPAGLTLHPLALGSSASVGVGAPVAAIGDPFGYERSLSTGIVSGVDRTVQAPNGFTVAHAIQTDAAMNPGNSGGPVLDANGRVVGIADQIATDGNAEQSSGVGFAVPIDLVKSSLKTLEAGGKVQHAYVGIATGATSSAAPGAAVSGVTAGGPADRAGLRTGDVVTALGGTAVADSNDLVAAVAAHRPGDKVTVTVKRGSATRQLTVTLGTQPAQPTSSGG